jgi:ParB family chromosome partitioning protein
VVKTTKKLSSVADALALTTISNTVREEIEQLSQEIVRLKEENSKKNELENQIAQLRQQLREQGGECSVALDKIIPNSEQPRQTFTEQDIGELARSLDRYGQLEPVILIPQNGETYLIFDGERRWRSAKQNDWKTINAVFMPSTIDLLHRKALITTLHRQDLNALDRAEAVLREIKLETGLESADSVQLIKSCIFRLDNLRVTRKLTDNLGREREDYDFSDLDLSDLEIRVINVLLDLSLNPSSFVAFDLKALSLPKDLKNAIRSQGLPIKHAFVLNRLSAKNLRSTEAVAEQKRQNATAHVLDNKLSEVKTREYVKSILKLTELPNNSFVHPKQKRILDSTKIIINELNDPDFPIEALVSIEIEIGLILEKIQNKIKTGKED